MDPAPVAPRPPVGRAQLPWDAATEDPVARIGLDRAELGDTFLVESGGLSYLFVFSADGVRAFYDIDESVASKGIADMRMLARKVPADLFFDRRTIPHDMFTRDLANAYLDQVAVALETEVTMLRAAGDAEVFAFTRRLGHRFGLASWGGPGATEIDAFEPLTAALDRLDASEAFVAPGAAAEIAANDHAVERAALAEIEALYEPIVARHDADPASGMFATIVDRWADVSAEARVAGIARDVALVHLGSMSNLFAAVGWALIDMVRRPGVQEGVRAGDRGLTERSALESIRMAQRSIMLREVVSPITLSIDGVDYTLQPGVQLATLLPLTNQSAAPGLDTFDPDRWQGRRLGPHDGLAAREMVTGFGHGAHTCPAQPFSLRVIVDTMQALAPFDLVLKGDAPLPRRGQIGGVARSEAPCRLQISSPTS